MSKEYGKDGSELEITCHYSIADWLYSDITITCILIVNDNDGTKIIKLQ